MDDLILTGDSKYINEIFLPKIQGNFDTSVSKIERIGDEFNFLRRKYKLEVDGLWIQPGNYIQQMLKAYEEQIGPVKLQQLPADNSIQMEDKSEVLREQEKISLFRSIVGSGIYLCQERYDVAFTVKELASRMSIPTAMSFHHLKKFLGYLKKAMDYCLVLEFPQAGEGYVKKGESCLVLGNILKFQTGVETKATESQHSGGFHALNSCPLFNSSRTQKIISLSSCEAELHAIVSSASDGIYIRAVLEFALGTKVDHYIYTDSSSARQLVMKRGVGKARHLDGKLLWIQNRKDFKMIQVPTDGNIADINAKPLGGQRIKYLLNLIGYWHSEDQVRVGEYERRVFDEKKNVAGKVTKIAKMLVRMVALEGLQPMVTEAFSEGDNSQCEVDAWFCNIGLCDLQDLQTP